MAKRNDLGKNTLFERNFIDFVTTGHPVYKVFEDFLELTCLSFCNAKMVKDEQREAREKKYMDVVGKYDKKLASNFAGMLSDLIVTIEDDRNSEILGDFFQEFITGGENGQYFTPTNIAQVLADICVNDDGSVTDPACGSGRTLIAGFEKNKKSKVYGYDLDWRCVKMCAINLFLRGAKGSAVCMNSLSMESYGGYSFGIRLGFPYFNELSDKETACTTEKVEQNETKQTTLF